MLALLISIICLGTLVICFVSTYYDFLFLKKNIAQAHASVHMTMTQRNDEVGTLIQTIKGHNAFEQQVIIDVAKARAQLLKTSSHKEKAEHDLLVSKNVKSVLEFQKHHAKTLSAEKKAQQERIESIENDLQHARQLLSETINTYNVARIKFPRNILAKICSFKREEDYYKSL